MKIRQYLYRRQGGHYYFRIRTPKALKSVIHTAEIKRSLKTTNFTIASKRALPYLSFIVRISTMTDIDEILRQLKDSGRQMMNLEITGLKIGDVEIDKMIVDPQKEGDREAASDFINSVRDNQSQSSQEIASKWFARIRTKLGWIGLSPLLDFHSFRHTVITALQEKEIPEYRIAALAGQKVGKGETFRRYGKGFSGKTLKDDIEMLSFDILVCQPSKRN